MRSFLAAAILLISNAFPAQADLTQAVTRQPAVDPADTTRPLEMVNDRLYFTRIGCTYHRNGADARALARSTRIRSRFGFGRSLETYMHLIAFEGFDEIVGVQSVAVDPSNTVSTEIAGKTITGVALPTILWDNDGGYSTVGADRMCSRNFFFRMNEAERPSAFTVLLASSERKGAAAQIFTTLLTTSAALITQVANAIPSINVPGLDDPDKVEAFGDAVTNFLTLFEGNVSTPQQPQLGLGRTVIEAGLITVTVDIYDRDRSFNGTPQSQDNLLITGPMGFSSNWRLFLSEATRLKLGEPGPEAADHACVTARSALQDAAGTGVSNVAFQLEPVDAAFIMLAALREVNVSAAHAVRCLGPQLTRASLNLTHRPAFDQTFPGASDATFNRIRRFISPNHYVTPELVALLPDTPEGSVDELIGELSKSIPEKEAHAEVDRVARGYSDLEEIVLSFVRGAKPRRHLRDDRRQSHWATLRTALGDGATLAMEGAFRATRDDVIFDTEDAIDEAREALEADGLAEEEKARLIEELAQLEAREARLNGWALEPQFGAEPALKEAPEGMISALVDLGFSAFGCPLRNVTSNFGESDEAFARRTAIFGAPKRPDEPPRLAHFAFLALRSGEDGNPPKAREGALIQGYLTDADGRARLDKMVVRVSTPDALATHAQAVFTATGGNVCKTVNRD